MDWIEQWFGIAPDNGDGTIELLIVLSAAAVIVSAAAWRFPKVRAAALRFTARLQRLALLRRGA